jgi:hypothetical protein
VGLAVATLLGVAVGLTDRASRPPRPSPPPLRPGIVVDSNAGARKAIACVYGGTDQAAAEDYCRRRALDAVSRAPLAPPDRAAAQARQNELELVLFQAMWCDRADPRSCNPPQDRARLTFPAPLDLVRMADALRAAGFTNVAVRLARPDDPVPAGTIVYAAGVGPACIVGWVYADRGQAGSTVEGQRSDGFCLAT